MSSIASDVKVSLTCCQVVRDELGGRGVEGWPSSEGHAEDPGVRGPAGQAEEGEESETVSAGLPGSCPTKAEAKGWCLRRSRHGGCGLEGACPDATITFNRAESRREVSEMKCTGQLSVYALLSVSLQVDSERSDASALKRENQTLVESCDSLEKARQKVVHDLGVKEQQVGYHQDHLVVMPHLSWIRPFHAELNLVLNCFSLVKEKCWLQCSTEGDVICQCVWRLQVDTRFHFPFDKTHSLAFPRLGTHPTSKEGRVKGN